MLTSSDGIKRYRPELLGKYQLQYKLENSKIVYANMESNMYFYSVQTVGNEQYNSMWAVKFYI